MNCCTTSATRLPSTISTKGWQHRLAHRKTGQYWKIFLPRKGRAAAALIRIGTSAVVAITQTATGASGQVQYYAAAILGYIGDQKEIAVLQSIADKSTDMIVDAIARRSIELIDSFNQPASDFVELANL